MRNGRWFSEHEKPVACRVWSRDGLVFLSRDPFVLFSRIWFGLSMKSPSPIGARRAIAASFFRAMPLRMKSPSPIGFVLYLVRSEHEKPVVYRGSSREARAPSRTSVRYVSRTSVRYVSRTSVRYVSRTSVRYVSRTSVRYVSRTSVRYVSRTSVRYVSRTSVRYVSRTSVRYVSRTSVRYVSRTSVRYVSRTSVRYVSRTSVRYVSRLAKLNVRLSYLVECFLTGRSLADSFALTSS